MIGFVRALQAAAEYGALTGSTASSQSTSSFRLPDALDQLLEEPLALVVGAVALILVFGLFKTRSYRS